MSETIYRVQDSTGRGPYRPGFSHKWTDDSGDPPPLPFWEEFGWPMESVRGRYQDGEVGGCGFRTLEQCGAWFTPTERDRLRARGYYVVRMSVDRILAENENQLVFARRSPLTRGAIVLPWSSIPAPSVGRAGSAAADRPPLGVSGPSGPATAQGGA